MHMYPKLVITVSANVLTLKGAINRHRVEFKFEMFSSKFSGTCQRFQVRYNVLHYSKSTVDFFYLIFPDIDKYRDSHVFIVGILIQRISILERQYLHHIEASRAWKCRALWHIVTLVGVDWSTRRCIIHQQTW